MSKLTEKDLERVDEPCKSCDISATGRGQNKKIYCNKSKAKLMGNWQLKWFPIPDCPLKAK
jgi:hypothetical protein